VKPINKIREKRLSPRRAPRRSLLPLSPKRTQVRLKSLLYLVWLTPDPLRTHGRPPGKSTVCGLNGLRPTLRVGALHLNPRPRSALLLLRPLSVGRFALLRFAFGQKIWHTYFSARKRTSKYSRSCSQSLAELLCLRKTRPLWFFRVIWRGTSNLACWQRVCRSRPDSSLWFAQSFGSRFLPGTTAIPSRRKAEAVVAALSTSAIAETEHARSEQLDNPESIYRACADMRLKCNRCPKTGRNSSLSASDFVLTEAILCP